MAETYATENVSLRQARHEAVLRNVQYYVYVPYCQCLRSVNYMQDNNDNLQLIVF